MHWVIAKAETEIHGEILRKVGADRIVFPEFETDVQVAHSIEIRHSVAYMNLSPTSGVARMMPPQSLLGLTIAEIEAARANIHIILVQRGNVLLARPREDLRLLQGDTVLVAGLDEAIDAFADR